MHWDAKEMNPAYKKNRVYFNVLFISLLESLSESEDNLVRGINDIMNRGD